MSFDPEVVSLNIVAQEDLLVHRENAPEPSLAYMLSRMRHPEFQSLSAFSVRLKSLCMKVL